MFNFSQMLFNSLNNRANIYGQSPQAQNLSVKPMTQQGFQPSNPLFSMFGGAQPGFTPQSGAGTGGGGIGGGFQPPTININQPPIQAPPQVTGGPPRTTPPNPLQTPPQVSPPAAPPPIPNSNSNVNFGGGGFGGYGGGGGLTQVTGHTGVWVPPGQDWTIGGVKVR